VGHGRAPQDLHDVTSRSHDALEIEVHRFANLADYGPRSPGRGAIRVVLPSGATVGDLLGRLGVPEDVPRLVLVNGRDAEATAALAPGDVVDLLPPLVGG
jgi:sulfur carrier protein ThiS